jgi:predicted enzyme related to lactoylglutathione lyase
MITSIATAAVYVQDQEQSVDFWTAKVGFVVHASHPMGPDVSWIEVGPHDAAACLVLYPKKMMPDWAERKPSIVFACEDVSRTYDELSARGVRFTQPPKQMAWGDFAIFEDLDGNSYGLRPGASTEPSVSQTPR